ncbi:hypothetical protein EDC02_2193 [Micromonospora sp. Llam0]|uniref:hypothetical protein n=1 Tax=Micromonospora sp. Llam0 TaxID=2485143 RepID=UPI000F46A40E|nr:hypothetical protein [Micromonospora sp. Llam0]ROO60332.1 hypothetical protein EDC02_2193 [Micromonospora sp. Llam0]
MGTQAVVTIIDQFGATRSFWGAWASPEYLIPYVADFLTWVDHDQHQLTTHTWLTYADTFPGTLPRVEVTGTQAALDDHIGDLDYRYRLSLHQDSNGVLLQVYNLRDTARHRQGEPTLIAELTRANLFAEAARLCDVQAERAYRQADLTGSGQPSDGDPAGWRRRANRFREVHASTPVTALNANLAAQFHPATYDVQYPSVRVAGIWIFGYVHRDGTVRIAVHLDEVEPWLLRPDRTVPMRVAIQDTTVFEA